jgi:hypothetical protein
MQLEAVQAKITGHEMQAKTHVPADAFHGKNPRQTAGTVDNLTGRLKFRSTHDEYQHSQNEINIKYQNQDGDSFELSMQAQSLNKINEDECNGRLVKNPFQSVSEIIKQFIQNQIQKMAESSTENKAKRVEKSGKKLPEVSETKDNAGSKSEIPEFWNARNTAERISKFAVTFHGKSGREPGDFANEAVAAVKKGFEGAGDTLNGLEQGVSSLNSEIQGTVIENIETWARAKQFEGFATAA